MYLFIAMLAAHKETKIYEENSLQQSRPPLQLWFCTGRGAWQGRNE
jgi:hypothetical protein